MDKYTECEKNKAFKQALLWLLDNSDIKKDEKQAEIKTLRSQIDELNRKLEQLEAN